MITAVGVVSAALASCAIVFVIGLGFLIYGIRRIVFHLARSGRTVTKDDLFPRITDRALQERLVKEMPAFRGKVLLVSVAIGAGGAVFVGVGAAAMELELYGLATASLIRAAVGCLVLCVTLVGHFACVEQNS
jgi:hypothetical protein